MLPNNYPYNLNTVNAPGGTPTSQHSGATPAATNPLDPALTDSGSLPPLWTVEPDFDTQWFPYFAPADFDLEMLDFSLPGGATMPIDAMMGLSPPPSANPADSCGLDGEPDLMPRAETHVQRSWHTFFSEQAPSGYETPNGVSNRYHIDETYHKSLADRLQPRVQSGRLPSITFLNLCIEAYFTNFHPMFPIIHAPSFRPRSQNGLLLLSICSIGSLFLGSSQAVSHGIDMYERLNKAILASWETLITKPGLSKLIALQGSAIGQIFGLLMGRPKDLTQIELFHGSLIAWARKLRLFDLDDSKPDVSELGRQDLDEAWKQWCHHEEKKRIVLAIFLLDSELGSFFHHDPVLRHTLDQIPRTSSNEVFAAPTSTAWKTAMINQAARRTVTDSTTGPGDTVSLCNLPDTTSDFGLYVMLERIGSVVCDSRRTVFPDRSSAFSCRNLLESWYSKYRRTAMFERHASSLMMLWHSIFMTLHMNLDVLESACGRDGMAAAEKVRQDAQTWARSGDAKRCIIHAILAQKHFERMSLGVEPPIHAPLCLYRCGIAWFCYSQFGDGLQPQGEDDLDLTELQLLRINGRALLMEELKPQDGRPAASPLFRIIDLLRRISHWKVALNLASTLSALFEAENSLF
ncbi:Fc.00g029570.m01.CDS01 [Cosmosporella sp. VM-42]